MLYRKTVLQAAMIAGGLSLALAGCDSGEEIDREAMAEEIKADLKAEMEAENAASEEDEAQATAEAEETEAAPDAEQAPQAAAPSKSGWRNIKCAVSTSSDSYNGPCEFMAEAGGSFAIQRSDEGPIVDEVSMISVTVTSRGAAQVSGLTTFGNNSRWGEAYRSQADKACWVGDDFEVCAY